MHLETDPSHPDAWTYTLDALPDGRGEPGAPEAEWLETDGRGGYASSTPSGTPNRRYHGLLVAVPDGTAKRHVFLAGLLDRCVASRSEATLTRLRRQGDPPVVPPDGARAFSARPWPRTLFDLDEYELSREVLVPEGRRAVLVRYVLRGKVGEAVHLLLEPLLAFREADALTFENEVLDGRATWDGDDLRFRPYDALPAMTIAVGGVERDAWEYEPGPRWVKGVEYQTDLARGYGGHEDLFAPGVMRVRLRPGESVTLSATIDDTRLDGHEAFDTETTRRRATQPVGNDLGTQFASASGAFLYRDESERRGVLAGFPWFGEWGRDTFLALPGLTLARGDLETCAEVLSGALPFLRDGLLPNIFGTGIEDSHYGSADAALWFARAVLLYERAGGDRDLVEGELVPALTEIAEAYQDGTASRLARLGIHVDDGALLHVGSPDRNPTWMDAQTPAGPVTPRYGYPVEINALWCSLLAHRAEHDGRRAATRLAKRAGRAFVKRFWLDEDGILLDVWREDAEAVQVRPNMVLAAALELSPLTRDMRRRLLARAESDLLTPYGLRTLAPSDPAYRPLYGGGPEARDGAYHQGTVWPWLLGFFCEASLRVDPTEANRVRLRSLFEPLAADLGRGGLGHVSEVYDGDAPHRRGGTLAQAWSTAEVMRALALLDGTLPLSAGTSS